MPEMHRGEIMTTASKEWVRECPNADYTVLRQCARSVPANIAAMPFGAQGMIVELLDGAEPERPVVRDWNPVEGA